MLCGCRQGYYNRFYVTEIPVLRTYVLRNLTCCIYLSDLIDKNHCSNFWHNGFDIYDIYRLQHDLILGFRFYNTMP